MPRSIELTYAFGCTVTSMQDLIRVWEAGKDFKIKNGSYTSIRDLDYLKQEYDCIVIRASSKDRACIFETVVFRHILSGITSYV